MSELQSTDKVRPSGAKPRADIYTVILALTLTAMVITIVLLVLELGRYEWDYKATKIQPRMVSAPLNDRPLARQMFA